MSYMSVGPLAALLLLISQVLASVPFREKSPVGNYKLKGVSVQAFTSVFDAVNGLRERCTRPTQTLFVYCEHVTPVQIMELLQQDDNLMFMDAMHDDIFPTTGADHQSKRKRSVPWNLDRLNQISGVLDESYRDEAEVDVYIIGSGIRVDHAEFGNRASVGFSAFPDNTDCDGSGTQLASLVGGNSLGIARRAHLIGVKVVGCDGESNEAKILLGIQYVRGQIIKSANETSSVVLIGFTHNKVNKDINQEIVSLTETSSGILVVVGAGESEDGYDACSSTPASAQGATALNGVVSVGGVDEDDATVSNIGECVDLFAPGVDVPAAGASDAIAKSSCSGSLCAAALATGVVAKALRDNSKIDIEVQKSMLINGATVTDLTLPEDDKFDLTKIKAQTPRKILYYTCGYERDSAPPVCESYTSECNNSRVSTFDEVSVPLFQQKKEKCGFTVFSSAENHVNVIGSYHECSLGAYTVSWLDNTILLLPGPTVFVNSVEMLREGIKYDDASMNVSHVVSGAVVPHEPLVVATLIRDGTEEIRLTFDCVSRLTITLLTPGKYDGKTGGLCGFYDEVGTNDYRLPNGTELSSYSTTYHEHWRANDAAECYECDEDGCPCVDAQCREEAEKFCSDKFAGASADCLSGVNVYKETQACIQEVAKCCCQEKEAGNSSPNLGEKCCQNSYFGNFERNRAHCAMCTDSWCEKEEPHQHCRDDSGNKRFYDYNEVITYSPEDCCYYIPQHDTQTCTAPRNEDMMWDKAVPVCEEKTCIRPGVPNNQTIISPDQAVYQCGDMVTVTCTDCHEMETPKQLIYCSAGQGDSSNDAHWNQDIHPCEIITCPDPQLPDIDDDKSIKYPLSWITSPIPHGNECGDTVSFQCDTCYEMRGDDDAICQEDHRWSDSPVCRLRYCDHPGSNPGPLVYPLDIKQPVNQACNDTIEYFCNTRDGDVDAQCYQLDGDIASTCRVDDDMVSIGWDSDRPSCNIKHCPELSLSDLAGEGFYRQKVGSLNSAEDEYKRIWLTDEGYNESGGPTECGSEVEVVCDECHYLCGQAEKRVCLPDGNWSEGRPRCAMRMCDVPANRGNETHAVFSPDRRSYECGEAVTFSCNECYEYEQGTEVHTCQPDPPVPYNPQGAKAKWDGNPFSCKIKECSAIEAPANGYFTSDSVSTKCGSLVTFACDECYELKGEPEVKCHSDKTWSHDVPVCVKKECSSAFPPNNGAVDKDNTECGQVVDYTCDHCYDMVGSNYSECLHDRSWSHPQPRCEKWECEHRESPENGDISNKYSYMCGEEVTYECNECYAMSGDDSATCLHGGTWDNPAPSCSIKTCPKPDIPLNTGITPVQDSYNCGEHIRVECDPCYELDAIDIHCLDGGWEGDVPSCGIKQCTDPGPLTMSNSTADFGRLDGSQLSQLVRADQLNSGTSASKCGDLLEYECDVCYTLQGEKTIRCEENKQWSQKPVCELKICEAPEELTEHLVVAPSQQIYSCKEPIRYSCDDQCWSLEGSEERVCKPVEGSNQTTWYPDNPPQCYRRSCLPPLIDDTLLSHDGNYTCGSTIQYSCPTCFRLVGPDNATCTANDEWNNSPPTCEPVCCPELELIRSGDPTYDVATMTFTHTTAGDEEQMQFCAGNHVCQQVEVTCQECYEYIDQESNATYDVAPKRTCEHPAGMVGDGDWTNKDEVCTRKQCEPRSPSAAQHLSYTEGGMGNNLQCGDNVTFVCDACYEMLDGSMEHTCQPNKRWSDVIPTCELKECSDLPVIEHCPFSEGHRTCGSQRMLDCEDCWYTDKCKAGLAEDTSVVCNTNKAWEWEAEQPVINIKTCDAPPDVDHASFVRDGSDYNCSRLVKYECDECYEFRAARDCNCAVVKCSAGYNEEDCTKGSWVGTFPTCVPITCEGLPIPANASVITQEHGCKDVTQFECDRGYALVAGDLNRTCTTSGEWTGSAPVCRIRNCTELGPPDHGSISTPARHYGTVATFHCDDCYKFPETMTDASILERMSVYPRYHILMCEEHGNWNGSEPVCSKKYCEKPNIPENANLTGMDFYCQDQIEYTCLEGYYRSEGDSTHTCGTDSKWEGEDVVCEEKTCVEPAGIDNGDFSPELEDYVYNTFVNYDCDYCHEPSGQLDLTCEDRDGSDESRFAYWDASPPSCSRIQCDPLVAGPNSVLVPEKTGVSSTRNTGAGLFADAMMIGTYGCSQVLRVTCSEGYEIKGVYDSVICRNSGKWSRELPQCERTCCKTRVELNHGYIVEHDDAQCYGDRITFKCDTCFHMTGGESSQQCQADSTWSSEVPNCERVRCDRTPFKKGTYTDDSYNWGECGSTRTFECNEGYLLRGSAALTCREDGTWSGEVPTCEATLCSSDDLQISHGGYFKQFRPTIEPPEEHGDVTAYYPHYSMVAFECEDGYELIGLEDAWCQPNGSWSNAPPKCSNYECPEPEDPANGHVTTTHLTEGGIATFECDRCHRLEGYTELHCVEPGEWSPLEGPTCRENVCYRPGREENSGIVGYNDSKSTYSCDEQVEYECDPGYKLHGDTSRTCGETGQWSGSAPVCADVTCEPLDTPSNGGMRLTPANEFNNSVVEFWCNKGYQLGGDSYLPCVKGQWQGVPPTCSKQVCGDPGTPEWGNKTGDSYSYGETVVFQCDVGYQLRGPGEITCNHKGLWDHERPDCACNECPRLGQPANGYVQTTDSNAYNSRVTYNCYPGYEIIGEATRECTASGDWSGLPPSCQRLNCTSAFEIPQEGYVGFDEGHSYGDTIEIKCNDKKGGWVRTCQADGMWSGEVPDRCDCRKEVRQVAVRKKIVKKATCQFGKCTPQRVRWVTVYEPREFTVCD